MDMAMSYSNDTCTTGCSSFDKQYSSCVDDNTDVISAQCICQPAMLIGALNACTVCDVNALGNNDLSVYQQWNIICNAYTDQGQETAQNLAAEPDTNGFIDIFSSSLLPQLQRQSQVTGTATVGPISTTSLPTCTAENSISMTVPVGSASPTTGQSGSPATSSAAASVGVQPQSLSGSLAIVSVLCSLLGLL